MRNRFIRIIERLGVFFVGLILLYFVVNTLFPWLHQRLPLVVALFAVYLITAYILLPALIHIIRLFWKPMHIPAFTYSGDGWKLDPVNIGVVATERELARTMELAGWHVADKHNLKNMIHMGICILLRRSYDNAPVSSHFLFGRAQDYAFEIPLDKSPSRRHHARFWACVPVAHPTFKAHFAFWQARHLHKTSNRKMLWIGAATLDVGIAIQRRNLQITHDIDADSGKERDFLIKTLEESGQLTQVTIIRAQEPYFARHQTFMTRMIADGTMKICELKEPKKLSTLANRQRRNKQQPQQKRK
jgi:hypothetical protein